MNPRPSRSTEDCHSRRVTPCAAASSGYFTARAAGVPMTKVSTPPRWHCRRPRLPGSNWISSKRRRRWPPFPVSVLSNYAGAAGFRRRHAGRPIPILCL